MLSTVAINRIRSSLFAILFWNMPIALLLSGIYFTAHAYPGPYPPGGSCNVNGPQQICLAAPFSSNVVLQRAPAAAAITGSVPAGYGKSGQMVVTVSLIDETNSNQSAVVNTHVRSDRTWKVLLPPRPAFGNYSLTAQCTAVWTKKCACMNVLKMDEFHIRCLARSGM